MKMYNQNKLIGIILAGLLLVNLTGCINESEKITKSVTESISNADIDSDSMKNNVNNAVEKNDNNSNNVNENQSTTNGPDANLNEDENLSKDEIIINYFNEATDDINNLLSSDNVTNAKAKCKEYFITFVDFIFYDGKIKDITFSELKENTKMTIIKIVEKVDTLIMKKFPDYKETISETSKGLYEKASDVLHSGKEHLEDYIISKVGEDKYHQSLEIIDEIKEKDKETWNNMKDFGSDVYETGKDKIKTWYENFRNK
ncbi:MAG: hypothetical protein HFI87_01025 [Bacilli bacterium]|nr:hypothetical protein [Bacilli bacterium]